MSDIIHKKVGKQSVPYDKKLGGPFIDTEAPKEKPAPKSEPKKDIIPAEHK